MNTKTTHIFFITIGLMLITGAIGYLLSIPNFDPKLVAALMGVGVLLVVLALWLFYKTGIVRVVRRYELLSAATTVIVFGFLIILTTVTLYLMDKQLDQQIITILSLLGGFFMLLGTVILRNDKTVIRIARDVR